MSSGPLFRRLRLSPPPRSPLASPRVPGTDAPRLSFPDPPSSHLLSPATALATPSSPSPADPVRARLAPTLLSSPNRTRDPGPSARPSLRALSGLLAHPPSFVPAIDLGTKWTPLTLAISVRDRAVGSVSAPLAFKLRPVSEGAVARDGSARAHSTRSPEAVGRRRKRSGWSRAAHATMPAAARSAATAHAVSATAMMGGHSDPAMQTPVAYHATRSATTVGAGVGVGLGAGGPAGIRSATDTVPLARAAEAADAMAWGVVWAANASIDTCPDASCACVCMAKTGLDAVVSGSKTEEQRNPAQAPHRQRSQ